MEGNCNIFKVTLISSFEDKVQMWLAFLLDVTNCVQPSLVTTNVSLVGLDENVVSFKGGRV